MLLRILLITLTAISLGCKEKEIPRIPHVKVFTPIFIKDQNEVIDWSKSYMFGVDQTQPFNSNNYEHVPIHVFIEGETTKEKPRLIRGSDYILLMNWAEDITAWIDHNCEIKE